MPGAVNAWETLLAAHGRKGLDELLQPAIRFAADGWPVHPEGGLGLEAARGQAAQERRRALPAGRRRRRNAGDLLRPAGAGRDAARHRPPRRARRSTKARSPPTWWRRCATRGGLHTEADFAAGLNGGRISSRRSTPALARLRRFQCPPNGQGILVLMMLGMLGGMADGARRAARRDPAAPAYRGGAARSIATATPSSPIRRRPMCRSSKLLSAEYLAALRGLIRDDAAMRRAAGGRRGAAAAASRHRLSLRRRSRRQRVQLHQLAVRGLRLAASWPSGPA